MARADGISIGNLSPQFVGHTPWRPLVRGLPNRSDISMRVLAPIALLFLLGACASTVSRIMVSETGRFASVEAVADEIAGADLIALGELHQTPGVHQAHHALLRALYQRRPPW